MNRNCPLPECELQAKQCIKISAALAHQFRSNFMARAFIAFVAATSLVALGYVSVAQEGHEHHGAHEACAKACNDCQRACDSCATHCAKLVATGKKEHLTTLQTCQDCATHCSAAAQIVSRGGPFSDLICQACAEACKRCAAECNKHPGDEMMKKCADECLKCEKACREMLAASPSAK
jgi:hypothetical protein